MPEKGVGSIKRPEEQGLVIEGLRTEEAQEIHRLFKS